MKRFPMRDYLLPALAISLSLSLSTCTHQHDPLEKRVPENKIEQARKWKAPFGDARSASPEIVAAGKSLFEGRGNCYTCHGMDGKGDGRAASKLPLHPPRDFTDCKFHEARSDGELFWVVKYGIPGTGMVRQIPWKLSDEQTWKIVAYLRTFCEFT